MLNAVMPWVPSVEHFFYGESERERKKKEKILLI